MQNAAVALLTGNMQIAVGICLALQPQQFGDAAHQLQQHISRINTVAVTVCNYRCGA